MKINTYVDEEGDTTSIPEGTPLPGSGRLLWSIEAATWEEGMSIINLRLGHGPYHPMGEPERCPKCPAYYYPHGSGKCCCGYDNDGEQP